MLRKFVKCLILTGMSNVYIYTFTYGVLLLVNAFRVVSVVILLMCVIEVVISILHVTIRYHRVIKSSTCNL